jgi:PKD repeat protein
MKSLMTFMGIAAFNFISLANASDFSCPVTGNIAAFTCSGTVKVETLDQLNVYKNSLGVVAKKPTVAKNLLINFNPALTADLAISTPCSIKIAKDVVMTSTANICLHGAKGITIDENFNFNGKNLLLESKEEVVIKNFSTIKALDIKLLSIGSGDTSKAAIREGANIEAANLSIESFDKGFVGKNSVVKLTGALGIYTLGDDEASVREGARVEAAKIEISSTEETRIAKSTHLVANEIILNGVKCTINKTAVITAVDRIGNCFLASTTTKAKFSIDKNQGGLPLTVNFNASTIVDAKGFVWSFGDGETLNSLTPNVTHVYNRVGSFTATLKYATKENYKGLKSAGSIQIDVKDVPVVVPVPPKGYLKYQIDNTFVYLSAFITKTTYDIANAYYIIDDNPANKIQIPNFYQNAISGVELNTYGRHKATMHVVDVQGQTYSKSMNIYVEDSKEYIYPYVRLDYDQSAPRTMFFDMSKSFNPSKGKTLRDFKIDFGDGQTAVVTDATTITHTYAQAGTYHVKVTAELNGNEDFDQADIEVTNDDSPIMNPLAGFEYNIYDYAGNVVFADERSGTPNGEIISYAWDFGDGTVGYGKNATNFYAPGDYLVTLTVTDTAGMRASQTQKISILDPGVDIAAILDCGEIDTKKLECRTIAIDKFNQVARVKLDWGDGQVENLTVADMPERGQSIRVHDYANFGTYDVKLTVDTSRGQTVYTHHEEVFTEHSNDVAALLECFTYNLQVNCVGYGSYSENGNIVSYKFDFGNGDVYENTDGELIYFFHQSGSYPVTLTVTDILGKTNIHTVNVDIVKFNPIANVSCITEAKNVSCNGFGSYDPSGDQLVSYEFDFGDGYIETTNVPSASHAYSEVGLYTVNLKITTSNGQVGYASTTVQTVRPDNDLPVIELNCSSSRPNTLDCSFFGSYDPDGTIFSYEIKFDENNVFRYGSPYFSYTYQNGGSKPIIAKVFDNSGEAAVVSKSYDVLENHSPVANFECYINNPQGVSCYSTSVDSDPTDTIIEHQWNFGDGQLEMGMFPSVVHKYSTGGTFDIKLLVKDQYGAESSVTKSFTVLENQAPVIEQMACAPNNGFTYLCTATVSDYDGMITERGWTIDGKAISGADAIYEFSNGGTYIIDLKVVDNLGKSSTKQITINIARPISKFTCIEKSTLHIECDSSQSVDPEGLNIIYSRFEFDEDDISEKKVASHVFSRFGEHTVKLFILNEKGVMSQSVQTFNYQPIYLAPVADYTYDVDLSFRTQFDAKASLFQGRQVKKYSWNFGDGESLITEESSATHRYSAEGYYNVSLTVEDFQGTINTKSYQIYINNSEVENPGVAGEVGLLGIDSDGDGTRDDVQRWISFESKNNNELKLYLKKLAHNYHLAVVNRNNEEMLTSLYKTRELIELCLKSKVGNDQVHSELTGFMGLIFFNTEERVRNSIQMDEKVGGFLSEPISEGLDYAQFCSRI